MIPDVLRTGPPIARRDIVIAAVLTVLGCLAVGALQDRGADNGVLTGVLFALVTVPVLWRRNAPLAALGATLVGVAIHVVAFGLITRCGIVLPVVFIEAYAAAAYLRQRPALLGLALGLGAQVVCMSDDYSAGWSGLDVAIPITVAVWAIGRVVRSRTRLVDRLEARTAELRDARDERARLEIATDRVRLSAELDELLRRRLADLTSMADAGADGDANAALVAIERESRATLDEMRAVVGVLRGDTASDDRAPQPTLTGLDALLVHAAGTDAGLTVIGSPRALPPGLELSAYRVVEHLLGALDGAEGTSVVVDFSGDALELVVTGASRRRPDAAIEKARERVALHHGTLLATVREGQARVVAAFPLMAAV